MKRLCSHAVIKSIVFLELLGTLSTKPGHLTATRYCYLPFGLGTRNDFIRIICVLRMNMPSNSDYQLKLVDSEDICSILSEIRTILIDV